MRCYLLRSHLGFKAAGFMGLMEAFYLDKAEFGKLAIYALSPDQPLD
jgi:hypothetical protein